ncbi:hypothetical protein CDAR_264411 [Caerostris darwini]|uniref:Uncharacterized protein n=1 Tax=Caerostris darwini TaxID=1538125 RepID=A0AAV4Q796_9ARAC|nr:hypothetical protein CDAR_264411 [Caerostris darwini]
MAIYCRLIIELSDKESPDMHAFLAGRPDYPVTNGGKVVQVDKERKFWEKCTINSWSCSYLKRFWVVICDED